MNCKFQIGDRVVLTKSQKFYINKYKLIVGSPGIITEHRTYSLYTVIFDNVILEIYEGYLELDLSKRIQRILDEI